MNTALEISKFQKSCFQPLEDNGQTKGRNYPYVSSLSDIRDICVVLENNGSLQTPKDMVACCEKEGFLSEKGKPWSLRYVQEVVSALRSFGFIESNCLKFVKSNPLNTSIGHPLSEEDLTVFRNIYETYSRFVDFHKLFLDKEGVSLSELKKSSSLLFSYKSGGCFGYNILNPETESIKTLQSLSPGVVRFWNVYLKWGMQLSLIESYPAKPFGIECIPTYRSLSLVYFINDMPEDFSIFDYLDELYALLRLS